MISIRNNPEFVFHKHWAAASWRYYKFYTLLKREKVLCLLSCMPFGSDFVGGDVEGVNSTLQFLREFDCPYVCPNLRAWADSKGTCSLLIFCVMGSLSREVLIVCYISGICVIRSLLPNGSLRDLLHKVLFILFPLCIFISTSIIPIFSPIPRLPTFRSMEWT
jgi:hypothetical protein